MPLDLAEYEKQKKIIERLRKDSARAEGELEARNKQLLEEFDCKDVEQAQALENKIKKELNKLTETIEDAIEEFKETYEDAL